MIIGARKANGKMETIVVMCTFKKTKRANKPLKETAITDGEKSEKELPRTKLV